MGCDIHLRIEIKKNSGWVDGNTYDKNGNVLEFYNGRSYDLFGILANVRNEHFLGAISDTRGLPLDCLEEHRDYMACVDFHSQTFFTYQELVNNINKYSTNIISGMVSKRDYDRLLKYGELPSEWCQSTTDSTWVKAEWYSDYNSLKLFVDAFCVIVAMNWKQYEPDEIRVLIAFDN